MTRRKVPAAAVVLPFVLCLIGLAVAAPATAAPCDSPGLLGVVGMCAPGDSATPRPTAKPSPSAPPSAPENPQPQPVPGAPVPSAPPSMPSPQPTAEPDAAKPPVPVTTATATAAPAVAEGSQSTKSSASAAAARLGPGVPAHDMRSETSAVSVAGILLALGGALIAAGGMVGLGSYPRP